MNPEMGPWLAEIELVKLRLLDWLRIEAVSSDSDPDSWRYLVDVIKKVNALDATILGVSDVLWRATDAEDWLGEDYELSDVWECAVYEALYDFKREADNA